MAAILHVCAGRLILMKYKENIIVFHKEMGNHFKSLIVIIVKSLQKEKIAQITYYEPQSAGINLRSPQSDSTPRSCCTLGGSHVYSVRLGIIAADLCYVALFQDFSL